MGVLKKLKSRKIKTVSPVPPHLDEGHHVSCRSISLATGSFSAAGVLSLTLTSSNKRSYGTAATKLTLVEESPAPRRPSRVFIRTADLHMKPAALSALADDERVAYVHQPSTEPPLPSLERDPNESWVALDDGNGDKAPLADATIAALLNTALEASLNKDMWTANGGTTKLLKSNLWQDTIYTPYAQGVPVPHARGAKGEHDVLVWSGAWRHQYRGHDLPAIRCEAIVNMSPQALARLLMDSTRVKEYNKMSIGREDLLVLRAGAHGSTKIVRAKARPPMLGKTLVLTTLLHMEELPGGGERAGYVIVSRAIAHADDAEAPRDPQVVRSEMLMGLNILRVVNGVNGEPDRSRCLMININHLLSPLIPAMFAKRLGLSAAVNFINDIRALC